MDETPVSLGSKAFWRDAALVEEHAPAVYGGRPMLYSVRSSTRLRAESTRARRAIPEPDPPAPPRDFAAYFQGSPDCDPNYAASHTIQPVDTRIIPTYPVGQSLRWHPYVETSSIEDITCDKKQSKTCRCTKCTTRNCTAKPSSTTLKAHSKSNNIMTFADIYTMTPKLTDTACGSCVVSTTRHSGVTGCGSEVAVRDTGETPSRTKCNPVPILKTVRRRRICDYNDIKASESYCDACDQRRSESGQDSYDEPSRGSCLYGRHKEDEVERACYREVIYNEGISDNAERIPRKHHLTPERRYSPPSRSKWQLRYFEEYEPIPYSHRYSSRYHRNCKHSRSKVYILDSDACRLVPSSPRIPPRRALLQPYHSPPYHTPGSIRLPRKVLTSALDIEHRLDPSCLGRYPTVPASKRHW